LTLHQLKSLSLLESVFIAADRFDTKIFQLGAVRAVWGSVDPKSCSIRLYESTVISVDNKSLSVLAHV